MMKIKLSELVVKCLLEHGDLTGREIAQKLNVPQKAVNVCLGHLRRKQIIIASGRECQTPYGTYTIRGSNPKWSLIFEEKVEDSKEKQK